MVVVGTVSILGVGVRRDAGLLLCLLRFVRLCGPPLVNTRFVPERVGPARGTVQSLKLYIENLSVNMSRHIAGT